jgi:26S proteasome regulatory subunit N9
VYVLAAMESAQFKLKLNQVDEVKKAIDESEKILDGFDSVETVIYASFYRVSAEYYKVKANYAQYYKSALLYLACVDLEELTQADRVERAYDLSLSALLGDMIYNFGELVSGHMHARETIINSAFSVNASYSRFAYWH